MNGNYIEGVFVKETMQSKGIGKMLLDYVKNLKPTLTLSVYRKKQESNQILSKRKKAMTMRKMKAKYVS